MFTLYLYLIIYFQKKAIKKTKTTNHDLSSKCIKNSLVVRTVLVFVGVFFWGGGMCFVFVFMVVLHMLHAKDNDIP